MSGDAPMAGVPLEQVGPAFVPVVQAHVAAAELDGEVVLYDEDHHRLHLLDATASAVWRSIDGATPLAAIADALADVYGAPSEVVLHDVVTLARELVANGVVAAPN